MPLINKISDLRAAFRHGPYAWPGGYPVYFIMNDGACLCFACAKQERRQLLEELRDVPLGYPAGGWLPVAYEYDQGAADDDDASQCAHCDM